MRILVFLFLISAQLQAQDSYFPSKWEDWKTQEASLSGFDQMLLDSAIIYAQNHEYSGPKDLRQAILKGFEREPYHEILGPTKKRGGQVGMILKNGYLVASWGDTKRVDMTFSVTKSYLSTIAGLAVQNGIIQNVDETVSSYIWGNYFRSEHNSKITWRHLLTQSSDWSGQLWGGYDWADRPEKTGGIDDWKLRSLNEPGTVFEYNDVRVNLLAYSLLEVYRKPLPQILREEIMDPIGASSSWRWYGYENSWVDIDGRKMQSVSGGGHSGGGIFINTEDHARFGLLFCNDGMWNEQKIIDSSWIDAAVESSQAEENYGFMWWLNKSASRYVENAPSTMFYAAGFGGNFIIIDQENDLVVVTRWLEPSHFSKFVSLVYEALD